MKRSFYEVLGVTRDADQAEIDTAYALAGAKLNAASVRGTAAAVTESRLLRDGYLMLSNPGQRGEYDAKLLADEAADNLTMMPAGIPARRGFGVGTVVLVVLTAVLGGIAYHHVSIKMDEVRLEHAQAVKRKSDEQTNVIVIDATQEKPVVINTSNAVKMR